jgi:hypothetical protein
MLSNRFAFGALAIACIGAAAGGGYIASRQNNAVSTATAASTSGQSLTPSSTTAPVQETEAIVDETVLPSSPRRSVAAPSGKALEQVSKRAASAVSELDRSTGFAPSSGPVATGVKASEPLPTQDRTWPTGAAINVPQVPPSAAAPSPPVPSVDPPAPASKPDERTAQDLPRLPDPPQKTFQELVIPADSVIGLQSETNLSSERARVEDRVDARVTRDVRVHDTLAIPAGARAIGSVVSVDRGGKFRERARIGIRFTTLVLADGSRVQISTETIYRDGEPPGKESAAKVGGAAVGGAILGAIFGGGKGAAIGATAGAGAGSATVMASERNNANLRSGEPITVRILSPVSVTIEQK